MPAPSKNAETIHLLKSHQELAEFCASLAGSRAVAIDTEFVGEKSYWASLEVIQVASDSGRIEVIDARAIDDLSPLATVLEDQSIEKIVHAGSQDIALFHRIVGAVPRPVFDTQLAAAFAGLGAQASLAALATDCMGVRLEKGHTVSDWSARPLTQAQLRYAADDVRHLIAIRDHIAALLEKAGRFQWFREEQEERLADSIPTEIDFDEAYRSVKEWGKISGRNLAILAELAAWRERQAQADNVPRRRVLADPALIALARLAPKSRDDMKSDRYLQNGPVYRYLDDVLAAVQRGATKPRDQWPRREAGSRVEVPTGFVELMQSLVRNVAEDTGISSTLLATSAELTQLAQARSQLDTYESKVLTGWRREVVGQQLLDLIEGRLAVRIHGGEKLVFETVARDSA